WTSEPGGGRTPDRLDEPERSHGGPVTQVVHPGSASPHQDGVRRTGPCPKVFDELGKDAASMREWPELDPFVVTDVAGDDRSRQTIQVEKRGSDCPEEDD